MDALALSRRLAALPAPAMQRATLRDHLAAIGGEAAARLCGELVRRGPDGSPFDLALLALGTLLDGGELGYELHGALYRAASARGDETLKRLLLSPEPPPPGTPERAPIPDRPEITLGERKALARGSQIPRELLDRMLRDTDPAVLAILLGNPRVTEEDVVRLAARRPTSAAAQRVIFRSERFIVRYAIKRALAYNPYTPSDLAARLVPLLLRSDLRSLAGDSQVAETVREAARALARG